MTLHQPVIPRKTLYNLRFDHAQLLDTGSFVGGAGLKTVWHTTEGGSFDSARRTLQAKGAEPHFLLDPHAKRVWQFISLAQYARALEHPPGTAETNRGGAIQVEILGFAADAPAWPAEVYRAIAALALVIEHRTGVLRIADKPFTKTPHRVAARNWVGAHGHFGHQHVPSQLAGHWDPGALDIDRVFALMHDIER